MLTGVDISFLDGEVGSGTLWLDGSTDGTVFYNLAGGSHIGTGYNSIGNSSWSGETVI